MLLIKSRVPAVKPKGKRPKWFLLDLSILRDRTFWIMVSFSLTVLYSKLRPRRPALTYLPPVRQSATIFLSSLSYFPVSLFVATYTASALHSSDLLLPSIVVAAFNASAFVGSTVIGSSADRSLDFTVISLGVISTICSLCAWGFSNSLSSIMAFSILFGFGSRITAYFGVSAKEIAGTSTSSSAAARETHMELTDIAAGSNPHASTTILCFFSIFRGIASLAGPFISTALYQEQYKDSDQ